MANNVIVKSDPTIRVSSVKTDNRTYVASVTIGRPVRRVVQTSASIDGLQGIDTTNKTDGSILVYNSTTEKFEATTELEKQTVNGGSY